MLLYDLASMYCDAQFWINNHFFCSKLIDSFCHMVMRTKPIVLRDNLKLIFICAHEAIWLRGICSQSLVLNVA